MLHSVFITHCILTWVDFDNSFDNIGSVHFYSIRIQTYEKAGLARKGNY